jgi:putative membrane protein
MSLFAQATRLPIEEMIVNSFIFGGIGIVMLVLSYFIFDLVAHKIDFTKELVENKNVAVAIVIGAFLLGVAHVIAAVVGG